MPEIEHFISWLIEKTVHNTNCEAQKIDIGTLTNFIQMEQKDGAADPLTISLNNDQQSAPTENPVLDFRINKDIEYKTQFIKRIEYTPFYYSNVIGKNYSLKLVDFYQWNPPCTNIRIFIIQHEREDFELQLYHSLNGNLNRDKNSIIFNDWIAKTSSEFSWNDQEQCFVFKPALNDKNQTMFCFAFQKDHQGPNELSLEFVFSLLKKLEARSREHHIANYLVIKDPTARRKIDDLWMQQKIFSPGITLDSEIIKNPFDNDIALTWAIEIALTFGWNSILDIVFNTLQTKLGEESGTSRMIYWHHFLELFFNSELESKRLNDSISKQSRIKNADIIDDPFDFLVNDPGETSNKKEIPSGDDLIYSAYFTNKVSDEQILSFLQYWWEKYSYPLFINKFEFELEKNPEKVFLIYLLALRYQLPWADILYDHSHRFSDHIMFRIIAFIRKRLQFKYDPPALLNIFPGSTWDNNVKRIFFEKENLNVSFSKYSSKQYLTLKQYGQIIFRIDREVRLSYDMDNKVFVLNPSVNYIPYKSILNTIVIIRVDTYTLSLPLMWRQGELLLCGLRFRWLFKKERFQFTVTRKSKVESFWINEDKHEFSNSFKKKLYLPREKRSPIIQLQLLDDHGRYIHQRMRKAVRTILIYGYCLDGYGLFSEHFNYNFNKINHPAPIDRSGVVWQRIVLPSSTLSLFIQIKNHREQLNLMLFPDSFYESILRFTPSQWNSDFVVFIDRELHSRLPEIINIFENEFLFRPHFTIYKDMNVSCSSLVLIHICNAHGTIKTKVDKRLSPNPILEVGIEDSPENLEALYRYIIQPFKKLKLGQYSA